MGQVILGLACLGQHDLPRARRAFETIDARLQQERLLMDWIWRMPLAWGLARLELESGRLDAAAAHGRELVQLAQRCGEQTWLALGHAMLAQVAMSERRWKAAERDLGTALAIVVEHGVPLAAWRVHAVAADLHGRRQREDRASEARRSRDVALSRLQAPVLAAVSRNFHPGLTTALSYGS